MMEYIKNHKFTVGLIVFLSVIVIATIISLLVRQPQPKPGSSDQTSTTENAYGPNGNNVYSPVTTAIDNWTNTVYNLSDSERYQVESVLYETIKLNAVNMPIDATSVIRTDTYSQTYDPTTQTYRTDFLVDIPSLEQTYRVMNYYSDLPPEESRLFEYTTMIYCPTEVELIWENFECTDYYKLELGG
jgi:hypothetical protein